jgi:membrane protease YdiL (CAAX protease family)
MRLTDRYRDHPGHYWPRRPWFARDPYAYTRTGYLAGVRHPWPCLIFVSFMLALYELGVNRLQSESSESLRAGLELWLRQWLAQTGNVPPLVIPATVVGFLLVCAMWRWSDRPRHLIVTVSGITVEGVLFGVGLWGICLNAPALLDQMGLPPMNIASPDPKLVTYIGVGIYEEVIFRLIAFAFLARILRIALVPYVAAIPVAMLASSALFASAHHLVQTDPFVPSVFVTRMLVGVYCALLYWTRGLGVAIGAHVVYDIVVSMPQG